MNAARRRIKEIRNRANAAFVLRFQKKCKHKEPFSGEHCDKCHPKPAIVEVKAPTWTVWVHLRQFGVTIHTGPMAGEEVVCA
jgi:hypothetical protein